MLRALLCPVFLAFALASSPAAFAQAFQETTDAGPLPGTAAVVEGSGALTSIGGVLNGTVDPADMFAIWITGSGTFSASTPDQGVNLDPQLFLFTSAGMGVYGIDDISSSNFAALLPAGHLLTPQAAGLYYLAISAIGNDPVSTGGLIFPDAVAGVLAPNGPGGGSAISGWTELGTAQPNTGYTITLTGAEFVVVSSIPEPGSFALLLAGLGLLGFAGQRRIRGQGRNYSG